MGGNGAGKRKSRRGVAILKDTGCFDIDRCDSGIKMA